MRRYEVQVCAVAYTRASLRGPAALPMRCGNCRMRVVAVRNYMRKSLNARLSDFRGRRQEEIPWEIVESSADGIAASSERRKPRCHLSVPLAGQAICELPLLDLT